MNRISLSVLGVILLQLAGPLSTQAEDPKKAVSAEAKANVPEEEIPNAVVIAVDGECEYSDDGVTFKKLDSEHIFLKGLPVLPGANSSAEPKAQFTLNEGAVIRTGENSKTDIFFRRIGTTIRVQPNSEVKFEKMRRSTESGAPVLETLVHLRKGRIFTVVRSLVAGSTFEIRNAAGRSVVEGAPKGGMGRYIITADGTQVADKTSSIPIKLIADKGVTIIKPGQIFDSKEGKMLDALTPETVLTLIEFDELNALAEKETLR